MCVYCVLGVRTQPECLVCGSPQKQLVVGPGGALDIIILRIIRAAKRDRNKFSAGLEFSAPCFCSFSCCVFARRPFWNVRRRSRRHGSRHLSRTLAHLPSKSKHVNMAVHPSHSAGILVPFVFGQRREMSKFVEIRRRAIQTCPWTCRSFLPTSRACVPCGMWLWRQKTLPWWIRPPDFSTERIR